MKACACTCGLCRTECERQLTSPVNGRRQHITFNSLLINFDIDISRYRHIDRSAVAENDTPTVQTVVTQNTKPIRSIVIVGRR